MPPCPTLLLLKLMPQEFGMGQCVFSSFSHFGKNFLHVVSWNRGLCLQGVSLRILFYFTALICFTS
jgi:hypothetical protein